MQPTYPTAYFSKPLLNQAIALIQRDQAEAIALVNPQLSMIGEFHKGPGTRTAFPWLTLSINRDRFDQDAQVFTRHQNIGMDLALDVGVFDQEIAQDNAQDYARVLDMILTSASFEDWTTPLPIIHETAPSGLTTPNITGSVKEVFVEEHAYGVVTQASITTPVLRVTLSVLVELEEI